MPKGGRIYLKGDDESLIIVKEAEKRLHFWASLSAFCMEATNFSEVRSRGMERLG